MRSPHSSRYRRLLARLREARLEAGLTQADVAESLGRNQSFVSKCESGERRIDVVELLDLAGMYGKPLGFFVAEGEQAADGASLAAEREGVWRTGRRGGVGRGRRRRAGGRKSGT